MLAVLVGLASALVWGASDFLGGLASRRISAVRAAAIGASTGTFAVLLAFPALGGSWSTSAIALGALSGVFGASASALLYACLAMGPMSILSPVTAIVSAIVPLTVGLVRGEILHPIGFLALGLALVAVVLVSSVPLSDAPRPSGVAVLLAVGAGACVGAFVIVLERAPDDSGLVPLLFNRMTTTTLLFSAVGVIAAIAAIVRHRLAARSSGGIGWRSGMAMAIACGTLDATAIVLLNIGLRIGELSTISVLAALYPAGTIILAAAMLKERISPTQAAGLVLAVAAGSMLALA